MIGLSHHHLPHLAGYAGRPFAVLLDDSKNLPSTTVAYKPIANKHIHM